MPARAGHHLPGRSAEPVEDHAFPLLSDPRAPARAAYTATAARPSGEPSWAGGRARAGPKAVLSTRFGLAARPRFDHARRQRFPCCACPAARPHPARGPVRGRGARAPAAGEAVRAPGGPGIHTWLPLGFLVFRNVEHRAKEDGAGRGPGRCTSPPCCPASPTEARSLGRVRRQPLPPQGPAGGRPPAGADARGDVHPAGQGPVLVVQGPAPFAVPDPEQVPRRGPSPRRTAAGPRVHHEGRVLVRRRRGGSRTLVSDPAQGLSRHLPAAGPRLRGRLRHVGCHGRQPQRGVPLPARRGRGHLRPAAPPVAGRPTSRRCATRRHRHGRGRDTPPTSRTRPARRPSTPWWPRPTPATPLPTGAWTRADHPQERAGRGDRTSPAARRSPGRAAPGDPRAQDLARLGPPGRDRPSSLRRRGLRRPPTLAKGHIGRRGRMREASPSGIRYLLDPRAVDGTAWVTGADEAGRHVFDLVAGRDFSGGRHGRGGRGARR